MDIDLEKLVDACLEIYCENSDMNFDDGFGKLSKETNRIFIKYCFGADIDEEYLRKVIEEYVVSAILSEDNINEMNKSLSEYDAELDNKLTEELCDILFTLSNLFIQLALPDKVKDTDLPIQLEKLQKALWKREDGKSLIVATIVNGMVMGFKQFMIDNKESMLSMMQILNA